MVAKLNLRLTATSAIAQLGADDSSLVTCDLSNSAVLATKPAECAPPHARWPKGVAASAEHARLAILA